MAAPYLKTIKEETVVLVASNITTGNINKHRYKGRDMTYLATIRPTGDTAPTLAQIKDEGFIMFQDDPEQESISASSAIDVYVYCNNADGDTTDIGKVVIWV